MLFHFALLIELQILASSNLNNSQLRVVQFYYMYYCTSFTGNINDTPEIYLISQKYGCENEQKLNFQAVCHQIANVCQVQSASNFHCLKGNEYGFVENKLQDGAIIHNSAVIF